MSLSRTLKRGDLLMGLSLSHCDLFGDFRDNSFDVLSHIDDNVPLHQEIQDLSKIIMYFSVMLRHRDSIGRA